MINLSKILSEENGIVDKVKHTDTSGERPNNYDTTFQPKPYQSESRNKVKDKSVIHLK